MRRFSVLLLACYELGHQPLSLAWPLAVLSPAGFPTTARDLSVTALNPAEVAQASLVAIAVPMHTALRLGVAAAQQVRAINPQATIVFYGLYAWLNADYLLHGPGRDPLADAVIGGEAEAPLLALAQALRAGDDPAGVPGVTTASQLAQPHLARPHLPVPDRASLPDLTHYAYYVAGGVGVPAGYTETSRGCRHTCRHCPIVPIYQGRFFIVPAATVLADIRQQVAAGARHITFGDPDFLNGPGHARRVAQALHAEFPYLTFDFTTKVEHILQHRVLLPELRQWGATFVVSAFEAVSDPILARLDKGHTAADLDEALAILDAAGLAVQPTWVPFTPWTTRDDYLALLAWIRGRDLVAHVPAVQLSIRLLVPPHSALLAHPDAAGWCGPLDAANFTYQWTHPDPGMDALQQAVARYTAQADDDPLTAFQAIEALAYAQAGRPAPPWPSPAGLKPPPPRLTEDWFC